MSSHRDLGFSRRHTTNTKPLLSWCYSYCIRIVPTEPQSVQYPHPSPVPPHPVRVYATPPPLPHPRTKPRARVRVRMSGPGCQGPSVVSGSHNAFFRHQTAQIAILGVRVWACARRVRFRVSGSSGSSSSTTATTSMGGHGCKHEP